MQLSVLNDLKKVIEYNNKSYSFVIYVTAWENLCVAYANQADPHCDRIFSTVVDPESDYTKTSWMPEEVSTVHTVDDAIRHIRKCLDVLENGEEDDFIKLAVNELLTEVKMAECEELDLDLEEEENRPVYCEAPEGMIPIVPE